MKRNKKLFLAMLHKKYIDVGMNITGYFKPIMYFFGGYLIISNDILPAISTGLAFIIISYFIGMFYLKKDLYTYEIEISNFYNKFVQEMRRKIK